MIGVFVDIIIVVVFMDSIVIVAITCYQGCHHSINYHYHHPITTHQSSSFISNKHTNCTPYTWMSTRTSDTP